MYNNKLRWHHIFFAGGVLALVRRTGLPGATVVPCVRLLAEIALKMPSAAMNVDLSEEDFERLQPGDKAAGACARFACAQSRATAC